MRTRIVFSGSGGQGVVTAAILLGEPDAILALGAAVARELYGVGPPVIVLGAEAYEAIRDGQAVDLAAPEATISAD